MSDSTELPYRELILSRVGEPVRRLLHEIEDFAGLEVGFAPSTDAPRPVETAAALVDHERAIVYIPDVYNPTDQEVAHELAHIKRYWKYRIRQLDPINYSGKNRAIANDIDNMVEHIYVHDAVKRMGISIEEKLTLEVNDFLSREPTNDFNAKIQAIAILILRYGGFLSDEQNLAIEQKVQETGQSSVLPLARRLARILPRRKEEAVVEILDALAIPRSDLRWLRFDIRNRRRYVEKLQPALGR